MQTANKPVHKFDHDIQLCRRVATALAAFSDQRFHQITVQARDGAVMLKGIVATEDDRLQAEQEALAAIGGETLTGNTFTNELWVVRRHESFRERLYRFQWNRDLLWRVLLRRDVAVTAVLFVMLMPALPFAQAWWEETWSSRVEASVVGQLIVRGEPAAGATIVVQPLGNSGYERYLATTDREGQFHLRLSIDESRNPTGEFVAMATWFKPRSTPSGTTLSSNQLPAYFSNSAESPLRLQIVEGTNHVPPFNIQTP